MITAPSCSTGGPTGVRKASGVLSAAAPAARYFSSWENTAHSGGGLVTHSLGLWLP